MHGPGPDECCWWNCLVHLPYLILAVFVYLCFNGFGNYCYIILGSPSNMPYFVWQHFIVLGLSLICCIYLHLGISNFNM